MLNRRKAMIGYLVFRAVKPVAKRFVKKKSKVQVPGTERRIPPAALAVGAGGLAGALGGLLFWRKRRSRGEPEETPES